MAAHIHYYWGLPSSTIDWCEENYEILGYAAEFYNSLSSLVFVALAAFMFANCSRYGYLRAGYLMAIAMMAIVGLGSVAFHATLLYKMQLLDELPMIYGASIILYLAFDPQRRWSRCLRLCMIAMLMGASLLFTLYYVIMQREPIFHQAYFALLLALYISVTCWQVAHLKNPLLACEQEHPKASLYGMLWKGCLILVVAKLLWTMDNKLCPLLSHVRKTYLFFPLDSLLQLHTIWHMLSALALHYLVTVSIFVRENSQRDEGTYYTILYKFQIVPYVCRMAAHKKAV